MMSHLWGTLLLWLQTVVEDDDRSKTYKVYIMEMEEGDERNVLSQYDQEICRWMQTDTDNTLLPV